jgi:hypothetical protein
MDNIFSRFRLGLFTKSAVARDPILEDPTKFKTTRDIAVDLTAVALAAMRRVARTEEITLSKCLCVNCSRLYVCRGSFWIRDAVLLAI